MQFISREFDVFTNEFNLNLASEELCREYTSMVLPAIRDCNVNSKEHLSWIMVAVLDGKPVGYCYFWHNIKYASAYVAHIYVDANLRGDGVATQLIDMCLDFIFSTLPNQIRVHFLREDKGSKLVDHFMKRVNEYALADKYFRIEATHYSKQLKLSRH